MAKVTGKYQITLPPSVRKFLKIVPGVEVDIVKEGPHFILVVDPNSRIRKKWAGKMKDSEKTMDYIDRIRGPVH